MFCGPRIQSYSVTESPIIDLLYSTRSPEQDFKLQVLAILCGREVVSISRLKALVSRENVNHLKTHAFLDGIRKSLMNNQSKVAKERNQVSKL